MSDISEFRAMLRQFLDSTGYLLARRPSDEDIASGLRAPGDLEEVRDAFIAETESRIPADMYQTMDEVIGHDDYAPYVLDGQTAETDDSGDDYHDVVALVDDGQEHFAMKSTRKPGGDFDWRRL